MLLGSRQAHRAAKKESQFQGGTLKYSEWLVRKPMGVQTQNKARVALPWNRLRHAAVLEKTSTSLVVPLGSRQAHRAARK